MTNRSFRGTSGTEAESVTVMMTFSIHFADFAIGSSPLAPVQMAGAAGDPMRDTADVWPTQQLQ
jgi:hypothetical protein